MKQFKWLTGIVLPALFIAMLLQACENNLDQVKRITALESNTHVDTTKGVTLVYSDSARVKSRILAPLMLHYTDPKKLYYEMPQGVKIFFYDDKINNKEPHFDADKHVIVTVVSDYAITSNGDKVVELRKHVVITNTAGDVFTTEQLFYDANKKLIYSNVACHLTKVDGTVLDGTGFTSNETFTDYHFEHGKGDIVTNGKLAE
jgi:LPS export ABC transporter protein LptC